MAKPRFSSNRFPYKELYEIPRREQNRFKNAHGRERVSIKAATRIAVTSK